MSELPDEPDVLLQRALPCSTDRWAVSDVEVELFWLPHIGPTATWLLRRLDLFADRIGAPSVPLTFMGLGDELGCSDTVARRALNRLHQFHLIDMVQMHSGSQFVSVTGYVPELPAKLQLRLPPRLSQRYPKGDLTWAQT